MNADDIILEAERLGITLRLRERKIFAYPSSAVTPALAASIRANKWELFARLRERELELLPSAGLIQLTLPKPEAPTAASTEPAAALIMEHFTRIPDFTSFGRFGVIYADPPWSYRDLGHTRRIDRQYPILSVRDIAALPVQDIALPDAVLFLWIPVPLLPDGLTVMKAWRFDYKSNLVWDKEIFGMGHYARIQHEHLLLGTTGKPGTSADHSISSVIRERRGGHSVKPLEGYRCIERMYPALRKIELFARNCRPGWTSWGNDPALINSADGIIHQSTWSNRARDARRRSAGPSLSRGNAVAYGVGFARIGPGRVWLSFIISMRSRCARYSA